MSDETKIFTKNDKNGDKCASGGQESGLKLIFERGVAILVRPWRFPGQPKKFVFFSIKVGTINSGTSLDSREQFKKTGKLELSITARIFKYDNYPRYPEKRHPAARRCRTELIQSKTGCQSDAADASKHIRICAAVFFSSASCGSSSLPKYAQPVVSRFSRNSPPINPQRTKTLQTP